MVSVKRPDVRLQELSELFKQRNALYGDTYKRHGDILMALFSGVVPEATCPIDACRLAIINTMCSKLSRYVSNWEAGHKDSMDDISVYAQMICELDEIKAASK